MIKKHSSHAAKNLLFLILISPLIWGASTCSKSNDVPEAKSESSKVAAKSGASKVLAKVEGEPITKEDILKRIRANFGEMDETKLALNRKQMMFEAIVEEEILDRLLLKAAVSEGLEVEAGEVDAALGRSKELLGQEKFQEMLKKMGSSEGDYKTFLQQRITIAQYKKKLFKEIHVDEEQIGKYYEGHQERLFVPEAVRLETIVVEESEDAETIYRRLKEGESFDAVVQEYTGKYKKRVGGKMKWMPYDAIPQNIRFMVKQAKADELLKPLVTNDGVAVIKILEKRESKTPTPEEAKTDIEQIIRMKEEQKILDSWYEGQKKKVKVEYVR